MADDQLIILVIDDKPPRAELVLASLRSTGLEQVIHLKPSDRIPEFVANLQPDVILMDVDAPTRDTLEQVSSLNRCLPRPIVMFTMDHDRKMISDAIKAGVTAYIVDGLADKRVRPIIDVAIEQFREFKSLRDELERTRASLEDRKLIERAKGILMNQRRCSEPEAYRTLQKLSMNQKQRMVDIARSIILAEHAFNPHSV